MTRPQLKERLELLIKNDSSKVDVLMFIDDVLRKCPIGPRKRNLLVKKRFQIENIDDPEVIKSKMMLLEFLF